MEGLFPRRSSGWLILTIITIIFFGVYYDEIYPALYRSLIDQYKTHGSKLDCGDGLEIQFRYPKRISEYMEQKLLIEVINNNSSTVQFLGVSVEPVEYDYGKISVTTTRTSFDLTGVENGNLLPAYIKFNDIPPQSSVSGIFWMYVKSASGDKMELQISCFSVDQTINKSTLSMMYNQVSALQHGLIGAIVLPPWSNVFLLVIALVIVKLTEDYVPYLTNDEGDNKSVALPNLIGKLSALTFLLAGYSVVVYGLFKGLSSGDSIFSFHTSFWVGIILIAVGYVVLLITIRLFIRERYCPQCGKHLPPDL